jgi:ATP-dependent DNA helicase RecQ
MALTATATERVRADIVTQLGLRDPGVYVASFNRPNLDYCVEQKARPFKRLVEFLRGHPGKSGIVYCGTRRGTESLAGRLRAAGLKAAPYHAGMEIADRARNQESFLHDRVQVICATIAFGMGVNKPNIRFVVHYDLPKNIESYYQETGRAGRDGDPADCLLLFGNGDLITHERRIDEKESAHEREIARQQLEAMVHFCESKSCRRRTLLAYFGEAFPAENCAGCDNCTRRRPATRSTTEKGVAYGPPQDRTADARRFLACLDEITRTSFPVGAGWVADVLTGSANERIRKHGHERLLSYGRGRAVGKAAWGDIGRALLDCGFLRRTRERMVLEITPAGRDFGLGKAEATIEIREALPEDNGEYDAALFEKLRGLRKRISEERGVPAFHVFSDVALRQMARDYPTGPDALIRINGVGRQKLDDLGPAFVNAIAEHLAASGRLQFTEAPAVSGHERQAIVGVSERESLDRFRSGQSVETIAAERGLKESTVLGHLATCLEAGEPVDLGRLVNEGGRHEIDEALKEYGTTNLSYVRDVLDGRFEYGVLRMCRTVFLQAASLPGASRPCR